MEGCGQLPGALIGILRKRKRPCSIKADTSFAEDLGVESISDLMRLLGWRFQADELKTGSPDFEHSVIFACLPDSLFGSNLSRPPAQK